MSVYIAKRQFLPGDFIFYEGLMVGLIAGLIIQFCIAFFYAKIPILSSVLLFILFTSLGPTILDRSVSITVLAALKSCEVCSKNKIETQFVEIYLFKNQAIKKRLNEQIASGNIIKKQDSFSLTERGNFIFKIIQLATWIFKIPDTYLNVD